jgi:hypothetical protein
VRKSIVIWVIMGFVAPSFGAQAEGPVDGDLSVPAVHTSGSYPLCGSLLLHDQEQWLLQYAAKHPEAVITRLPATAAWGFTVGSTHAWYAHDYVASKEYLTNSTCRGVGIHCYIFVEDSMWTTGRVNQNVVDSVMNAFDNAVPANPSKGVYQMDVDAFGNPPDVDNDPRIIILILNIRDGYAGSGGYIAGYFYGLNELNATGSNRAEIYYLDANPANLKSPSGLEDGMSTTAHEFQHMIHWNYNPNQIAFVNEGCSLVAEVNCGYPIYSQYYYSREPNHYLLDWRTNDMTRVLYDYSRAARYFTYLRDQFGMGLFAPIVQNGALKGISSISYGFAQAGSSRSFNDVYLDWEVANKLNDRTVSTGYGYVYPGLPKPVSDTYADPNLSTVAWIQRLGARYLTFAGGTNLKITETAGGANVVVREIAYGSPSSVDQLSSGVQFAEPGFGTLYDSVTLVLMNSSTTDSQQVTIQASGDGVTAVRGPQPQESPGEVSSAVKLEQNYPNPFNPTTMISAQWTAASEVRLVVYDVLGRTVATLADGRYPAGKHTFTFDGNGLGSGVYFCRLSAGSSSVVRKLVLMR